MSLDAVEVGFTSQADELLEIDEALTRLAAEDPPGRSADPAATLCWIIDRGRCRGNRHIAAPRPMNTGPTLLRSRLKTLLDRE